MVTMILMERRKLITKEKMESYCKGNGELEKEEVNDDLESVFDDIRLGKNPDDDVRTYFLPKLTKSELKLIERRDYNFMDTFLYKKAADVSKAEMEASESDSKFVRAFGIRITFTIKITETCKFESHRVLFSK